MHTSRLKPSTLLTTADMHGYIHTYALIGRDRLCTLAQANEVCIVCGECVCMERDRQTDSTDRDRERQKEQRGRHVDACMHINASMLSPRSHSIFILTLEQTNVNDGSKKKSKLFMVDLAGSETVKKTGAEGQTLKEAQAINKSLSALSNVIFALSEGKASHIPYRDSKLTRLLQEALGGNCRTALIINVSPARLNEAETISTMRFGKSAKKIKTRAHINKEQSAAELQLMLDAVKKHNRALESQIAAKDSEIALLKSVGSAGGEGGEVTHKVVELSEELDRERQSKASLAARVDELEKQVEDLEAEHEEQVDALKSDIDKNRELLKAKDSELDDATLKLKSLAEGAGGGGGGGISAAIVAGLESKLRDMSALANEAEGSGGWEKMREMISELQARMPSPQGEVFGGDGGGQRQKEDEEQMESLRQEAKDWEAKYKTLLEEKVADADDFAKKRLQKTEDVNSTLLRKAKEDSKLLEARELEIQIFEKRLLKNNQRIKILELLLTDTRAKNDQLKMCIDGSAGGGGRVVKGGAKAIQGGSGRRALHSLAQVNVTAGFVWTCTSRSLPPSLPPSLPLHVRHVS